MDKTLWCQQKECFSPGFNRIEHNTLVSLISKSNQVTTNHYFFHKGKKLVWHSQIYIYNSVIPDQALTQGEWHGIMSYNANEEPLNIDNANNSCSFNHSTSAYFSFSQSTIKLNLKSCLQELVY